MRRIIIQGLLSCLLALFPGLMLAQTLTSYEYWFDDDVEGSQTGTLSGKEDLFIDSINTEHLPDGVHFINFRAKQSDGQYSSVTSSCFYKMKIEKGSILEYWIDNDRNNVRTIEGSLASDGKDYIFNRDLDMRSVSPGLHRLNLRPRSSSGLTSGAITTADFIKISNVTANKLEYWIDGDLSTVQTIDGLLASDGKDYIFVNELNLDSVTPGYHRLYYRAVSSTDLTASAVCMSPIIVKSRYYHDENEPVLVVKYGMTVDDEPLIVHNVSHPSKEVAINQTLDVHDLKAGGHRLNVQVWNSANASVSLDTTFIMVIPQTPTVVLSAEQNNGLVTLRFNSVPNDVSWKIIRIDANGSTTTVRKGNTGCYPNDITVVDNPINGQYTYRARVYYDNDTEDAVAVNSNDVSLTMTQAENVRYGTISGLIKIQGGITLSNSWVVKYSDSNIESHADALGTFVRDKVPVGTLVTLTAQDVAEEGYVFEPKTITVKEGRNDVTLIGRLDIENMQNSYDHDLEFASRMDFTPGQFMSFSVRNVCRQQWNGRIRVVSVKKAYLESEIDPDGLNPSSGAAVGAGSVAPISSFSVYNDYDDIYSEKITVDVGHTKEIYLNHTLNSMHGDKDEMYYFFVYSVDLQNKEKLIGTNYEYNITENPIEQLVPKDQWAASQQQVMEEDVEYAVNIILSMMKKTKEIDGYVGDVEKGLSFIKSTIEDQVIYDALNSNSWAEFVARYPKESVTNIAYEADVEFLNMIHSVRDQVATLVRGSKDLLTIIKGAQKTLNEIKLAEDVWTSNNELEVAAYVAEKILSLSDDVFPLAPVLKSYLDITEKTVYNVLSLIDKWETDYEYEDFIQDNYTFKIDIKRKWTWRDIYSTDPLMDLWLYPYDVKGSIDYVVIDCTAETHTGAKIASKAYYKPQVKESLDGWIPRYCYLERYDFDGQNDINVGMNSIRDMRMTIYWKNGRVTHVPICNSSHMQGNAVEYQSRTYTIHFQSGTSDGNHLADIIHLDE